MVQSLTAMPPSTRKRADFEPGIGRHRRDQVAGLVADRFERGAGDLGRPAFGGQPDQGGARLRRPMRRAEPGKTGHQVKALARVGARGEIAGFGRSRDDAEPIAQPLHRRTGDKDAAFEGIGGAAVESIGDRRQQTVMGAGRRARRC